MMSLIADLLMIIVVSASILYAINKKPENKHIATDDDNDDDNDSKKEEENEFISEWISAIKEIIEYRNKITKSNSSDIIGILCSHKNPKVLDLIKLYPDNIDWSSITYNREPWAIKLLTDNINKIHWDTLCRCDDEFSINLLIDNKDQIIWGTLCGNKNPKVIPLLKERIEYENKHHINIFYSDTDKCNNKINWYELQQNPNAKELIMNRINDEFSGRIKLGLLYIKVNNILPIFLESIKNKDIESVKIFKKLIIKNISNNINNIGVNWSTILNTLFND